MMIKGRHCINSYSIAFVAGLMVILTLVMISCEHRAPSYEQLESGMLQRLRGTWQVEGDQQYEEWQVDGKGNYHAVSYQLEEGSRTVFERIKIIRGGDEIYYEATVTGQNEDQPVKFRLTELEDGKMVFTNPRHDFPRKIEYEFIGDDRLKAIVSDDRGDQGKSFIIHYQKLMESKKVTGIGGIFFKCEDPEKMREWYSDNLGLATDEYGSLFEFRLSDQPEEKGYLQWSPFSKNTNYFEPSKKDFMINYRVENLERLVEELRQSGVTILDSIEVYEYGKFIHILDPENNKIELWEPVSSPFTESYEGKTTK